MYSERGEPSPHEAFSLSRQALWRLMEEKEREADQRLAQELARRRELVQLQEVLLEKMSKVTDLYELGEVVIDELRQAMALDEAALALLPDGQFLEIVASTSQAVPLHQLQLLEEAFITGEALSYSGDEALDCHSPGNADLPSGKPLQAIPLFRQDERPLGAIYLEGSLLSELDAWLPGLLAAICRAFEDCVHYNEIERHIYDAAMAIATDHEALWGQSGRALRVENLAVLLAQSLALGPTRQKHVRYLALLNGMSTQEAMAAYERVQRGELTTEQWGALMGEPFVGGMYASPLSDFQRALDDLAFLPCRWDGCDARGLRQDEIPLSARIVAVASAFERAYSARRALGSEATMAALRAVRQETGGRYDPQVVDALDAWLSQAKPFENK